MKKFFITVFITLATVISLTSAVCVASNINDPQTVSDNPNAVVEYSIPNITSGSMKLSHFEKIFNMMPYDIQEKSVMAFNEIIVNQKPEFTYCGVKVKHTANTWEFYYSGASVIVRNATDSYLTSIFQMPTL